MNREVYTYPNYDGEEMDIIQANNGYWYLITKIIRYTYDVTVTYQRLRVSKIKFIRSIQLSILRTILPK